MMFPQVPEFKNPFFRRGHPELLSKIQRKDFNTPYATSKCFRSGRIDSGTSNATRENLKSSGTGHVVSAWNDKSSNATSPGHSSSGQQASRSFLSRDIEQKEHSLQMTSGVNIKQIQAELIQTKIQLTESLDTIRKLQADNINQSKEQALLNEKICRLSSENALLAKELETFRKVDQDDDQSVNTQPSLPHYFQQETLNYSYQYSVQYQNYYNPYAYGAQPVSINHPSEPTQLPLAYYYYSDPQVNSAHAAAHTAYPPQQSDQSFPS